MTAPTVAGVAGADALARLCSAPAPVFCDQVWARQPWLSPAADLPGDVGDVFSAAAVDELLSRRGLRTPFIRLAKDGRLVPPARYTGSGGAGAMVADQVHDDAVLRLFAEGTTVVLQGVHRTWEPVGALAASLAAELGHPVQVNAYVTPPQSQGFASHYDTHDVFVLQVAGRKQWRVHEPVLPAPLPDEPWEQRRDEVAARAEGSPVVDTVLEPGDCLYLPRGFLHSAVALGGTSIHLTFGIHATTQRDVVRALADAVVARGWRSSLPVGWDPSSPQGRAEIAALAAEVAQGLLDLDAAEVASRVHDHRAARQRPEPVSPLAQAAAAADLQADDLVRLRAHLGARLDGSSLVLPGRTITLEPLTVAAVRRLLEAVPATAHDLPLDAAAAVVLLQRLMREGVLVPASPGR